MRVLPIVAYIPWHLNPSTAEATAHCPMVAALYVAGIIIQTWVAGVFESKSWGPQIRLRTTLNEAAECCVLGCCLVAILLKLLLTDQQTSVLLVVDVSRY